MFVSGKYDRVTVSTTSRQQLSSTGKTKSKKKAKDSVLRSEAVGITQNFFVSQTNKTKLDPKQKITFHQAPVISMQLHRHHESNHGYDESTSLLSNSLRPLPPFSSVEVMPAARLPLMTLAARHALMANHTS
jgi:hypothetical protein